MKNTALILLVFLQSFCIAQSSNCDAILQHGLRNVSISMSDEASISRKYENHCNKDFSLLTDEQLGSIEVEVFGYGGGNGSYSRNQREENLLEWCKTNEQEAISHKSTLNQSSIIYGRAYDAYERCLELKNQEIKFDYQPSDDYKTINISMQYIDPTSGREGIYLTGVEAEGFTYEIKYVEAEGNRVENYNELPESPLFINRFATNILFKRSGAEVITENGQAFNKIPRGSITIQTSSKSLHLFYPEEYEPTIPEVRADELKKEIEDIKQQIRDNGIGNVGEIVASMLSEEEFKKLKYSDDWVLADGRKIGTNNKFYQITGKSKVPDLRGVFLRGKNHKRDTNRGNPEGDLSLGEYRDDVFKRHDHGGIYGGEGDKYGMLDKYRYHASGYKKIEAEGGIETRPRNVTVNYFIKIN